MSIYIPYTYIIGFTEHNVWYYGSRYGKGANPSDLWESYFTSSKKVKEFVSKYGNPDIIQIRKTFNNSDDARLWEHKVLKRMNVTQRDDFLNQTDNIAISSDVWRGKTHSPETRKIISEKAKLRYTIKQSNPFYGKKHTEETKQKISKTKKGTPSSCGFKGKTHTVESREKISKSCSGNKMPESMKQKLSEQRKGVPRPKITCPHCDKKGAVGLMHRWHLDNCKFKT